MVECSYWEASDSREQGRNGEEKYRKGMMGELETAPDKLGKAHFHFTFLIKSRCSKSVSNSLI